MATVLSCRQEKALQLEGHVYKRHWELIDFQGLGNQVLHNQESCSHEKCPVAGLHWDHSPSIWLLRCQGRTVRWMVQPPKDQMHLPPFPSKILSALAAATSLSPHLAWWNLVQPARESGKCSVSIPDARVQELSESVWRT